MRTNVQMESIRMNRIKIKTLHFHPNQHRTKRPTGFIRPTATTRYSSHTTQKRETAWDKNRIIQTIKKAENLNKIKAFCPFLCMREMGLEPTRAYTHKILSLACLPIPALPRCGASEFSVLWNSLDYIIINFRFCKAFFANFSKTIFHFRPVILLCLRQKLLKPPDILLFSNHHNDVPADKPVVRADLDFGGGSVFQGDDV